MLNEEKSVGKPAFSLSPASAHGRPPILGSTSVHHASFYRGQAVGHRGNPALSPRQLHFSLDRSLPHFSPEHFIPAFSLSFAHFPFPSPFPLLCPSSPFIPHPRWFPGFIRYTPFTRHRAFRPNTIHLAIHSRSISAGGKIIFPRPSITLMNARRRGWGVGSRGRGRERNAAVIIICVFCLERHRAPRAE